ncbi:hypothetical protein EXIGLDRAFT_844110 [Exidia glandulosa HHB12029]|uniref:Myb-like domain-containing protein n=1 Tax=Exidia glandulosa HHB12029 TaxID=1314781 RepID=A0A165C8J9_EXIGL|nr:hypothetical protein EXIGLDRAFT_844110 [Exidia glandulosa HHB12029]
MEGRSHLRTQSSPPKQRRGSLPASPALNAATGWAFRDEMGLPTTAMPRAQFLHERSQSTDGMSPTPMSDDSGLKRMRRKWTAEETQMLVDGCNSHGVGNWKAILSDPKLTFEAGRTPVDLKDRFRTYFPDAYRQHYPNAKTHLSDKVRSTLPNGGSIFEKTRTKRRRPFSQEEDDALRRGYEMHGTLWAQIAQDPVFQAQQRRSTDLRDRFRNAFPELYEAAGYKPRTPAKKGPGSVHSTRSSEGPSKHEHTRASRAVRRRLTYPGMIDVAGGFPSSDAAECSSGDEDHRPKSSSLLQRPHASTSNLAHAQDVPLCVAPSDTIQRGECSGSTPCRSTSPLPEHDSISLSSQSHPFSGPGSPSSPRLGFVTPDTSREEDGSKSSWPGFEWLSSDGQPGLPHALTASSLFSANMFGSFNAGPHHDVVDRYDLYSSPLSSAPHTLGDYASEMGPGGSFSEADMDLNAFAGPASSMGFTHHSHVAGDLIFASHHGGHLQHGHGFSLESSQPYRSPYTHNIPGVESSAQGDSGLGLSNIHFAPDPSLSEPPAQFDPHSLDPMLTSGNVSLALLGQGPHEMQAMPDIFAPPYGTVSPAELTLPSASSQLGGDNLSTPALVPPHPSHPRASRPPFIPAVLEGKESSPGSGLAVHSPVPSRRLSPSTHYRSASQPPAEHRLLDARRNPLLFPGTDYNPPIGTRDDSMHDIGHRNADSYQVPFLDLHYYGVSDPHTTNYTHFRDPH